MNTFRKIVLLVSSIGLSCLLIYAVVMAAGARPVNVVKTVYLPITDRGDTAEVMSFTPTYGVDSFLYYDTIAPRAGGAKIRLSWTSPSQKARIVVDTAKKATKYNLLIDLGTNARVCTVTTANAARYDTKAGITCTLAYLINNLATVKDTIAAEDSATYVKLRSKIAQASLEGDARWAVTCTDATDHKLTHIGDSTITTVAMVCDSMSTALNALVTLKDSLTGIDSTTFYTVTADQKGLAFIVYGRDTAEDGTGDTATLVVNAVSYSSRNDTIPLASLIEDDWFCNAYEGWVILSKTPDTNSGVSDSTIAYMMLKTTSTRDSVVRYYLLDSTCTAVSGACSLRVARIYAAANDTLFKDGLSLIVIVQDTTSDTNNYLTSRRLAVNLTLKNQ